MKGKQNHFKASPFFSIISAKSANNYLISSQSHLRIPHGGGGEGGGNVCPSFECQNLSFCILRRNPCRCHSFSPSLCHLLPFLLSYVTVSSLCRLCLASNRASFNTCPVHNCMSVKLTAALRNVLIHSSAPSFVSART